MVDMGCDTGYCRLAYQGPLEMNAKRENFKQFIMNYIDTLPTEQIYVCDYFIKLRDFCGHEIKHIGFAEHQAHAIVEELDGGED
jgi:hypothetical protein